jgi:acetoin utilization deacetylase AcuC-like enzyme
MVGVSIYCLKATMRLTHSGNGVQQAFYQDPNVLYISLHVHENGMFYPSGPYGDHVHCGAEAGLGKYVDMKARARDTADACRNINIPWPTKGMGDADYLLAFQQVVMPVAYEFDPDLVISKASQDKIGVFANANQSLQDSTLLMVTNSAVASSRQLVMLI